MHRRTLYSLISLLLILPSAADAQTDKISARYGTYIPVPGIDGSLVITGGGDIPETAYDSFIALAGGPENARIVVISTASSDSDNDDSESEKVFMQPWRQRGIANISILHARSREVADHDSLIEPLKQATGVWFVAGPQSRLIDRYRGVKTYRALQHLLERGGVIGGGPALGAVMTEPMVADGFGFLPGCVIQQYTLSRDRDDVLNATLKQHPGYFGVAVDDGTAIVVRGRRAQVVGDSPAIIAFAAGNRRESQQMMLRPGTVVDLIALSRTAVSRDGESFPPDICDEPRVANGTLVIGGGGRMSTETLRRFITAAGGVNSPIVVIPTALGGQNPDGQGDRHRLMAAGARNVRIAHAATPEDAEADAFLAVLRDAGGVWFSGGRQWRLVDSYGGTKAHELMREVLARGGAIGGSSAGASIQSEYMPRGHPLGNTVVMAEGYERGLGFLPGTAVDQHFTQRGRLPDMAALKSARPQLLGIGIDESTAIIVRGSIAEIVGENRVLFYDEEPQDLGKEPSFTVVNVGERYDLVKRRKIEE